MISAADARKIILEAVEPLGTVTVGITHALNSVIADEVVSTENVPAFDNAQMDGYAVRSADVRNVPATLRLRGEIPAGSVSHEMLQHGEAMQIMTGAKIPEGCDTVVQQEWTSGADDQSVTILHAVSAGHNIRNAGADIQRGARVLGKGALLRPQEIGVLASLGEQFVSVYRSPSVAILPTGNEVIELDKRAKEGSVRNSNVYTLTALVDDAGCLPVQMDVAKDVKVELRESIMKGLREDVLITSGGVSVGKYDLVMETLREAGVEVLFWKVNIKPGMPLLFGLHGNKPVFGLPGNPVSAMITFVAFVKPALWKMRGRIDHHPITLKANLTHDIKKTDGKRHYLRGIVEQRDDGLFVRTTGSQLSNVLTSLALANCLIILAEETEIAAAGSEVTVELL